MIWIGPNRDSTLLEPQRPFLKWLGGKRWLTPIIAERLPEASFNRYFEPFLGGGAFYFHFRLVPAALSDINADLVNTFIQVRDRPETLVARLKKLRADADTYYEMRRTYPKTGIEKAVRFLYLNRTAFAGVYRINKQGRFNVPFGNYADGLGRLWKDDLLVKASCALQEAEIACCDFEVAIERAGVGDLVYCDPTYVTAHNNNGFRKYNEKSFSWSDQERLALACRRAVDRGAAVIVSNACHDEIRYLYQDFEAIVVERPSVVCPTPSKRRIVKEYVLIKGMRVEHATDI